MTPSPSLIDATCRALPLCRQRRSMPPTRVHTAKRKFHPIPLTLAHPSIHRSTLPCDCPREQFSIASSPRCHDSRIARQQDRTQSWATLRSAQTGLSSFSAPALSVHGALSLDTYVPNDELVDYPISASAPAIYRHLEGPC